MPTRTLTVATLALLAGTLSAADKKLLSLVMPDVKVLAGVNIHEHSSSRCGRRPHHHDGAES